ncbi:MAG: glycosyltransferase family 39 protein [Alphaproteobacteria bacterium]|jgi:hypothetical protein
MKRWMRNPLFWILMAAAGLRLSGLFWGLPASDGWDDDGFSPRNFLTALALTWKPGSYFTYPPLHALLLAILNLPSIILALLHTPSLRQPDVIGEFIKPEHMTWFAATGRLVSLAMSLGIIAIVGAMARLVAGTRAGLVAAAACALNFGLTYYGQVGNLDVPYLFWGLLSLLWGMRAVIEHQVRRWWGAALFAGAAVATKDQAYALFLLSLPLFLVLCFAVDGWTRANARRIVLMLLPAAAVTLFAVLLLDGAITNPGGFVKRLAFLSGPASQSYAEYWHGPAGWAALLGDMMRYYTRGYGLLAVLWAGIGVWLTWRRRNVAGFLPLLAIISFTVCFNFAALRTDDRFLMPQAVLACVYIGIAVEMIGHARPWLRRAALGVVAVTALLALHQAIAINAAMLFDPRYDAESWMASHVRPGDTIETYGQNCFLPRFPKDAMVTRVGQGDLKLRNPLPGVREVRDAFIAPRGSRYVVLSTAWAQRYLRPAVPLPSGHRYSWLQELDFRNGDAHMYFTQLVGGKLPYRLVHVAVPNRFWPTVNIHDSLNEPVWIFERTP